MVELPGVVLGNEPDDGDDDGSVADLTFRPIETPQAAHHRLLIDKLEAIERGDITRLMVFMPPGSAKSTYASVAFPAWFMGKQRGRNVGVATYASPLAYKVGRRVRSVIRQPIYREIMGTGIAQGNSAAHEWALENGNEFKGDGILAGWTGNRLDGLVIDDPVKNREDADSEVIQEKTRDEYDNSLQSRLKPGGWIVIIQTRWNENDLSGGLLPEDWDGQSGPTLCRDGRLWEVLCIPAEAEDDDPLGRKPGEMLWPEWFGRDPEFWTAARRNPRTWSALYQQRPAPAAGTFLLKEWFRRYRPGSEPKHLKRYITSDHAPTDGDDSDPSGARVWGLTEDHDIYLLDGFIHRRTMDKTADRIIDLIKRHEPFAWFPEDDNNWKTAAPFIKRQMLNADPRVFTRIEPISPHGHDKMTKAQSFQGMAASGKVWIPDTPEGDAVIDQYVRFPAAKHDEEVDMAALMGRAIYMVHPAIVPPKPPEPKPINGYPHYTWDDLIKDQPDRKERI